MPFTIKGVLEILLVTTVLLAFYLVILKNFKIKKEYFRIRVKYLHMKSLQETTQTCLELTKSNFDHLQKVIDYRESKIILAKEEKFTDDEILLLIRLCHPCKHNNDIDASEILRKLLAIRARRTN